MTTPSTTPTSEVTSEEKTITIIKAHRYGLAGRTHHWIHTMCMVTFIGTGWQIHIAQPLFADMTLVRTVHIVIGIFTIFWDFLFYISVTVIDGHVKDIIPTPTDILDLMAIMLCALGIWPDEKYPHYDFYDPNKGVYVRKYHPGQKLLALADLGALVFIGSTGIALAEYQQPGSMSILAGIAGINILFSVVVTIVGSVGAANIRFIHFLLFVFFTCTTFIHAYLAIIPQNVDKLKGMIIGAEDIKDVEGRL